MGLNMKIHDMVALMTGASRGICNGMAEAFADEGADVARYVTGQDGGWAGK